MPKIPNDMSSEAVEKRAVIAAELKASDAKRAAVAAARATKPRARKTK
jgi:hypothetical protein